MSVQNNILFNIQKKHDKLFCTITTQKNTAEAIAPAVFVIMLKLMISRYIFVV